MRIALVHRRYTLHGGTEQYLVHLSRHLVRAGHEVHVFCNEVREDLMQSAAGVTFHPLPMIKTGRAIKALSLALSAVWRVHGKAFDIVQGFGRTVRQDVMRAGGGCHRVYFRHRMADAGLVERWFLMMSWYHRIALWIENRQYRRPNYRRVIAVSQRVRRELTEELGVDPDRIEVIYNGVDLEKFRPDDSGGRRAAVRAKHRIPEADEVILFLGTGFRRKGLDTALRAFARISRHNRWLLVVGRDATEERYRRLALSLGLSRHVVFCGPTREPETYYAASDLFVFPTRYEPFGNVCLEAMAAGLPVVTTAINGAAELFPEETRELLLDDPEDVKGLADRMGGLLADRERIRSIGKRLRTAAEALTWEANGRRVEALYQQVAKEKSEERT